MIKTGAKCFYIRQNGKIGRGFVRKFRLNRALVGEVQMSKNGLVEWVLSEKVYKTFGEALEAKRSFH